ncbi:sensor histidine kinase [Auritidibacter ignavus]|uniref:histidine kinase n=1 Tax=Auritidibacter ignavus TaxID=678932 RepID=A0AAJ6DB36_9MICC|nr:sensor histidine kinase [Auritidibacter ignavus]WGH92190.1 sensor histidine kinase [Auritidibacter ignavus]
MTESAEPCRDLPPHWLRTDALVGAGLVILGLIFTALSHRSGLLETMGFTAWGTYLSVPLLALPMMLYRRFPCAVASYLAVAAIVFNHTIGVEVYSYQIVLFVSFYGVGAWSNDRRRALWVRVGIIGLILAWLIAISIQAITQAQATGADLYQTLTALGSQWLVNAIFYFLAWIFGNSSWQGAIAHNQLHIAHQELSTAHRELHEAQQQLAASAVHAERMHIARELHDVVAHHVTVMGIHASAARRSLDTSAKGSTDSTGNVAGVEQLRAIETAAQQTIAELRALVYTLRDQPEHTAPLPDLSQLPDLVRTAHATSQTVRLEIIEPSQPGVARPEVPSSVQLTLYRIAQEGINNARKHAGATATVVVRLRYLADAIELEVSDHNQSPSSMRRASQHTGLAEGTGCGLQGLTERVTALDGTFTAGPKSSGGWLIRANIPLTETPADSSEVTTISTEATEPFDAPPPSRTQLA